MPQSPTAVQPRPTHLNRAPGALAPLLRDAWYVLAAREEFGRNLRQRWVLGEPLCFYESTQGDLIVLDDRCAHRRFPLSRSVLEGDVIRCRYHGFTYGTDGHCLSVPGGEPRSIHVRSYPAVQRGPWVWIWTGSDPDAADTDLIPWPDDELAGGHFVTGYTLNPANYAMVHENLLDLTHLEYLHGIGGPEFTRAAPELLSSEELPARFVDRSVGYTKHFDTTLSAFGAPAGDDPTVPVSRSGTMLAVVPALSYAIERLQPHDRSAARLRKVVITHCITPANDAQTHQFWMYWQDAPFAVDPAEFTQFVGGVFNEDVEALGWIQDYVGNDQRTGQREQSVAADVPGLLVRRMLHQLAVAEQSSISPVKAP